MEHVAVERDGALVTARLDRPPANAIDIDLASELTAVFDELAEDAEVRGVVLTGTGSFFSGGLDLKQVPSYGVQRQKEMITSFSRMVQGLYAFPKPLVGAVNGHAVAGGLLVALTCDYRIGIESDAKFGLTGVRAGISYPVAAMAVVRGELPRAAAREMLLGAEVLGVRRARDWGILDEVAPKSQLAERATRMVRDLSGLPPISYRRTKHQLRSRALSSIERAIEHGEDPTLTEWLTAESSAASQGLLEAN